MTILCCYAESRGLEAPPVLQNWEQYLGRLLSGTDRFWAGTVKGRSPDQSDLTSGDRMPEEAADKHTALSAEPQRAHLGSKDGDAAEEGSIYGSSLRADLGYDAKSAELPDHAAASTDGGQQQQEAALKGSQSWGSLRDLISAYVQDGSSKLPTLQPDFQAAITALQIQSLQEGLPPAASAPDSGAADMAEPVLAAELVSQAPMPPGPEPGSRTRLHEMEVQNWPIVAAAPLTAPLSAPQVRS